MTVLLHICYWFVNDKNSLSNTISVLLVYVNSFFFQSICCVVHVLLNINLNNLRSNIILSVSWYTVDTTWAFVTYFSVDKISLSRKIIFVKECTDKNMTLEECYAVYLLLSADKIWVCSSKVIEIATNEWNEMENIAMKSDGKQAMIAQTAEYNCS